MKDCAFQYATSNCIIREDTDLITRAEADALWAKYIPQFKQDVEAGIDPEMAIWIDMKNETDYHTTAEHWCGQDFTVRDGEMFMRVADA